MTDDHDRTTENRLVRALRARDAEVSPRGSLADVGARDVARSPWRRTPLLIAAAVVLIGGIAAGVALLDDDEDEQPDVAVDNPTTTVATTTTTEPTASSSTSTSTTTSTTTTLPPTPEWLAQEGLIVWPRDSRSFGSMEQAASTYVDEHIGIDEPTITYECCDDRTATALVKARGEGGRELDRNALIMTLVETDGTWDIVTVQSDLLTIDRVTPTPAGLVVAGRGTAFEGSASVSSSSYCDPGTTGSDLVTVGSGPDLAPFAALISAPDCDVAIVGITAPGVASGATNDHAEVAVRVAAPEELVVMRVEADDVLNVRSGPDAGASIVATLAPDASGIARTGETDGAWWEIITLEGVTGWASSAFLSVQYPLDDHPEATDLHRALIVLTQRAVQVIDQGLPEAPDGFRVGFAQSIDVGGIGVYADAPSHRRVDGADLFEGTTLDWAPFPDDACGAECSKSVAEFLDLRTEMLAEATYATDLVRYDPQAMPQYLIGLPDLYTERFATVRVEIPSSSDDVLDWRTYSFVYDFSGEVPEVIAIWRWGWTP